MIGFIESDKMIVCQTLYILNRRRLSILPGINSGILTNASPLTAEQIKSLEKRVLETGITIVYLNENKELCFAMPVGAECIKDLAWNYAYELKTEDNLITKSIYKKTSLDTIVLIDVLQKQSINDSWTSVDALSLLDVDLLDEFILA